MSIVAIIFALVYCAGAGGAPDPHRILDQALAASGGSAWDDVHDLLLEYSSTNGTHVELEDVQTGRFAVRNDRGASGFDGITTWTQGKSGVPYTLGDEDSRLASADEAYRTMRAWWFPARHRGTIAYAGFVREGRRAYDTIAITPEAGRPFTLWINRASHLIERDVERQAEHIATTTFGDYRSVDGVRLPFSVATGDQPLQRLTIVRINVPFTENSFSLPAAPRIRIADRSVRVPFRVVDGEIIVPAYLNGTGPYDCLFDTGGSLIVPPAVVAKLKLATAAGGRAHGGSEGSVASATGAVDDASIGPATIGAQRFSSFQVFDDYPERMVAGLEVLQRYVVTLDFDGMLMTLTPPQDFHYDGEGVRIPFHFQDNQPEVSGAIDGIAANLAIDTGDNSSLLLTAPFARRYNLIERYNAHIPYGGHSIGATHGVWAQRVGTVTLNDVTGRPTLKVTRPVTRISTQNFGFDANQYVSSNVGIGILRQFNLTFDYMDRYIVFAPNRSYGQEDVFNRAGLELETLPQSWRVRAVYPGGPAARAGIHVGDIVATVNGKTRAELPEGAWTTLKRGPKGSHIILGLLDGAQSRSIDLELGDDVL